MFPNAKDRRKAAAIPVLVLILGYVLWSQFAGGGSEGGGAASMLTTAAENFIRSRRETAEALEELNRMSAVDLDSALEHDPFAVLAPLDPEQAADEDDSEELPEEPTLEDLSELREQKREEQISTLQKLKVTAVLTSGGQPSALFGSEVVHIGDTLPGGATVVAIDRSGIVVRLPEESL
ncbi:hypothetical protein Mal4_44980 [Maioricimonas rarisocia]|uniref:Uncharacterized protein n=1 Tax=Maioricimonas rarisocia TaxID=2528026 RepID=A0A517ZCB8_9PLAN|nr:hypothetical protein [Maioricimonas rarisocia]QDU40143.1 hypothetical protein Mal4_44980 [Maioricimonas rarisocia]